MLFFASGSSGSLRAGPFLLDDEEYQSSPSAPSSESSEVSPNVSVELPLFLSDSELELHVVSESDIQPDTSRVISSALSPSCAEPGGVDAEIFINFLDSALCRLFQRFQTTSIE